MGNRCDITGVTSLTGCDITDQAVTSSPTSQTACDICSDITDRVWLLSPGHAAPGPGGGSGPAGCPQCPPAGCPQCPPAGCPRCPRCPPGPAALSPRVSPAGPGCPQRGLERAHAVALRETAERRGVDAAAVLPQGAPAPTGLTHGGAIATLIDTSLGTLALAVAGRVVTANLSIDYVAPVPLRSVLLLDASLQRREGRKLFLGCELRDPEGEPLYARATGLFIQQDPPKEPPRGGDSGR
ncbi:protein bassoon-like isoform X2 [Catharus ustulatus]|uniref:protein bassoon-like isoform X2 n=1 Tax=Catharus ustulatus TaxID=91951 RepID=UPI00140CB312|nr:protein bassoon-like isoform X2 [Catharus ustulatus]